MTQKGTTWYFQICLDFWLAVLRSEGTPGYFSVSIGSSVFELQVSPWEVCSEKVPLWLMEEPVDLMIIKPRPDFTWVATCGSAKPILENSDLYLFGSCYHPPGTKLHLRQQNSRAVLLGLGTTCTCQIAVFLWTETTLVCGKQSASPRENHRLQRWDKGGQKRFLRSLRALQAPRSCGLGAPSTPPAVTGSWALLLGWAKWFRLFSWTESCYSAL